MATHSERDRERLLAKIKKCLALAGSSNPTEAETALRQARKLMEALGLTMDEVEASKVSEIFRRTGNGEMRQAPTWVGMLSNLVGSAFSCTTLMRRGPGGNGVVFVGVDPAPELASYTFDVMFRQLTASRKKFLADNPVPHRRGMRNTRRKEGALFIEGWLHSVSQMIQDFAGMDEETARAVNAYMAQGYPDIRPARPARKKKLELNSMAELRAIQEGIAAGREARLHKAASVGASPLALPGSGKETTSAQSNLF